MHSILYPCWLLPLFFSVISLPAYAQESGKNIVLQSKSVEFFFKLKKDKSGIEVSEISDYVYRCNDYNGSMIFTETYNDREKIEDISIKVDDRKVHSIEPKYEYYAVEDIFYSDARICHFTLPFQKKGMTDEVILEKTYSDPRYFTSTFFQESLPIENEILTFHVPRWLKMELKEFNFKGFNIVSTKTYDSKEEEDIITYTAKNLPRVAHEPNAPGYTWFAPHLLTMVKQASPDNNSFTYFSTLADQYNWYHSLVNGLDAETEMVAGKAREITEGIKNDEEKVKAIFSWMHRNIRYIAYEDGIAGFKPAAAADVLAKKYGDCKGMANLTRNFLKSLGFDARLCWIGTNHIAYDYSTPTLCVDNHMICAWFYKGKKYFLDATETNIGLNEYAERIQGRQVLIENGTDYILDRVPVMPPEQNTEKESVTMTLDGTTLKGTASILYKGESKSSLLTSIQELKKDKLETSLRNYLAEYNQDYQISNLKTTDLMGRDSVLKIDYDFSHANGASSFGNEIYIDLDFRKELSDHIIDTSSRTTDWTIPYKVHMTLDMELTLPMGFKASSIPADLSLHSDFADITVSCKQTGNKLLYHKEIVLKKNRIAVAGIAEWNKMITSLNNRYKEQLIITRL